MDEFMHIRQKGSVDEYRARFSDMKVLVMRENPWFDEPSYMECFLGGFREEFKLLVMFYKPKSLQEAYEMAARQENVYEMLKRPKNLQKKPIELPKSDFPKP
jgi:hypothetical protein